MATQPSMEGPVKPVCEKCLKKYTPTGQEGECTKCKKKIICHPCKTEVPGKETVYTCTSCLNKNSTNLWVPAIILLTLGMGCVAYVLNVTSVPDQVDIREQVLMLKQSYPHQDSSMWPTIYAAMNKSKPVISSLILLYDDNSKTTDCLAQQVAETFSRIQHKKLDLQMQLEVYFKADTTVDHGELLEKYKPGVEKTGVLIITELQDIPGSSARVFHAFCDSINPLVNPALFLFTMRYDKQQPQNLISGTERILKEVWRDLPENELHPLLARVVTNVIQVQTETNIPCDT